MKQKLRLGDRYAPTNHKDLSCVQTHAQAPALPGPGLAIGVIALLLLAVCGTVYGQHDIPTDSIKPLQIGDTVKEKDLVRFPMVKHDPDLSRVKGLVIGDSIPDYLWDLPLWVVNHPNGRDTVTLREYQGKKLIVLDFWARWCAPCVRSMDKWEKLQPQLAGDLAVISIHLDYDYKALPFAAKRGWKLPVVIGENAIVINRHFYTQTWVGGVVFIKDGRLLAIPGATGYDDAQVMGLLAGDIRTLASNPQATYFDVEPTKTND
ncbi:TlpA family protein disulfide reductase [Parapedobacter sp. DT-150]|uniref:TlpA family protein disulfide reductase n=1 Tax=Parapedobacter sp. DT-150 TaxID=3396162 RepID=UPI003F1B1F6B